MVNKQQIRKLLEYGVKINLECEKAESIFLKSVQGITRVDDTPVHRAIRESVVNMMIHSDYMITGVLKVEQSRKLLNK